MKPTSHYLHFFARIFFLTTMLALDAKGASPNYGISEQTSGQELSGGWRFVRTPNPRGGADAISIMHIADSTRSDLDLAGLTIRCSKGGTELVVVLVRPLPPRARPHLVFGKPEHETVFEAKVVPPGTAILLPGDATELLSESRRIQNDLFIRVDDGHNLVRGVVALSGLQPALKALMMSCTAQ